VLRSGSKRHTLELLPGTVIPAAAGLVGLVLIEHLAGGRALGLFSLAWVTTNAGASFLSEGPSNAALRSVALGESTTVPGFRHILLRRSLVAGGTLAVVGIALALLGTDIGPVLAVSAPWILVNALLLFEIQVMKAHGRFARASSMGASRAVLGWGASVAGAAVSSSLAAIVLPNVAATAVVLVALGSVVTSSPDGAVRAGVRSIGRPVTVLLVVAYALGYADRYVIQAILGPVAVGVYTLGYQVGEGGIELLSGPVTNALLPRVIAEWHDAERGPAAAFSTARRGAALHIALAIAAVPALLVADAIGLLDLISKDGQILEISIVVAVAAAIQGITRLSHGLLLAQNRLQRAVRWAVLVLVVSAVTVPVLTETEGIVGTAYATLIAYTLLATLFTLEALRGRPS